MKYAEARARLDDQTRLAGRTVHYPASAFDPADPLQPFVPIVARFPSGLQAEAFALLDSGSYQTYLPWRMCEPAGLRWHALRETGIVGRQGFTTYHYPLRKTKADVYWNGHLITNEPCVFPPDSEGMVENPILGLEFFSRFDIGFRWGDEPPTFSLTPRA